MRKVMKKVVVFLSVVSMIVGTAACQPKFDAVKYVESYIASNFKGEFKEYAEICKVEESEAEKLYNDSINTLVTSFSAGIEMDDETKGKFEQLSKDILGKVKYTVDENAEYSNGEYTVKLKAECLQMKVDTAETYELGKEIGERVTKEYMKDHKTVDQTEYQKLLNEELKSALYDYFSDVLKNATYGEPKELSVKVTKNSDGLYTISQTGQTEIANALISME